MPRIRVKQKIIRCSADLENHFIYKVLSRKDAEAQRLSPPWWISPPHLKNKNQRPFSFLIRVKKK